MKKTDKKENGKDIWDRLEIGSKILLGIGTVIASILIPVFINQNAAKSRNSQVYTEIMSRREEADTSIRSEMFRTLLTGYLGAFDEKTTDENSYRKRIMFLNLLINNFQEYFNAKPLFEDIYSKLPTAKLKEELQDIAKSASSKQITLLSRAGLTKAGGIGEGETICVRLYDTSDIQNKTEGKFSGDFENGGCSLIKPISDNQGQTTNSSRRAAPHYSIEMKLEEIMENEGRIKIHAELFNDLFNKDLSTSKPVYDFSQSIKTCDFKVSYFDMPYMDNTRLFDGSRFAIVLKKLFQGYADIDIVSFREDFMSLRDRPFFEDMINKIYNNDNDETEGIDSGLKKRS